VRYALTGFLACFIGLVTWLAYGWLDDRVRRMWRLISKRVARLARRVKELEDRLEALADATGYVFTENVVHEPVELPATQPQPVVKRPRPEPPPTQPHAVVDVTPAVEARRSEAWDRDLAAEHERQARRDEWVEDALKRFQFTGRKR
jgi:hypothetical protein